MKGLSVFSTRRSTVRQMNFRPALRIRTPGSNRASVRIWKPLQTPITRTPAFAPATSRMTGDCAAMAPLAQIVAVGESAWNDNQIDLPEGRCHDARLWRAFSRSACSKATQTSRSQLEPGKTMTAAFMRRFDNFLWRNLCPSSNRRRH